MPESMPPTPTKWWQYFLAPMVLVALIGCVPTVINIAKAWYLDVRMARVPIVEEQRALWGANIECLGESPVYSTTVSEGITIGMTVCPSGDALLRYTITTEDGQKISYTWIRYPGQDTAKGRQARIKATLAGEKVTEVYYGSHKCLADRQNMIIRILVQADGCIVEAVRLADSRVFFLQPIECTTLCARVHIVQG